MGDDDAPETLEELRGRLATLERELAFCRRQANHAYGDGIDADWGEWEYWGGQDAEYERRIDAVLIEIREAEQQGSASAHLCGVDRSVNG